MALKFKTLFRHIALFFVVEVIFMLLIFHELPSVNVVTLIGIGHLIYWLLIPFFWWLRERYHHVWQKFLATYTPIVLHMALHIIVTLEIFHEHTDVGAEHSHEHSLRWLILATILAWWVILRWEYLLHRTRHCETHHGKVHQHCCDEGHGDCEEIHKK